ncbi:MAG TPA: porin, partial [Byssovorax sp.]
MGVAAGQPEPSPPPDAAAPSALAESAPPPPPAAGAPRPPEQPATQPVVFGVPVATTEVGDDPSRWPLAGWNKVFFLRDSHDWFHLYPGGRVNVDADAFFGPGVSDTLAPDGGNGLQPKIFLRRARLELAGDFTKYVNFLLSVEFGGQPLTNANGKTQNAAASPGQSPTADTAKFGAVQATAASAALFDVWLNLRAAREFNVMIGQEKTTLSMENRTSDNQTPLMERNVAIRGFVVPTQREIGLTAWGDIGKNTVVGYEGGVYLGDGQNRSQVDEHFDGIGRVFVRPFAADASSPVQHAQIGVSGRYGQRDPRYVGYDESPITTGQGYALWNTTYKDSLGRTIHVIPSHAQAIYGGELRVPVWRLALQSEAYYVASDTREAVDGYQLTNTERFGELKGVGWYAMLSAWPWGQPFIAGDPGFVRPTEVDFGHPPDPPKAAVELLAVVAGVDASYDGASRQGTYDSKTPGADGGPGTAIQIRQF